MFRPREQRTSRLDKVPTCLDNPPEAQALPDRPRNCTPNSGAPAPRLFSSLSPFSPYNHSKCSLRSAPSRHRHCVPEAGKEARVDCPFLEPTEEEELKEENVVDEKYKLKPPKDLRSKFLQMMEQREIDKVKAEEEKLAEEQRLRTLEEEKRPPDELEGLRVHAWILLRAGERKVETSLFIEPSTGFFYPLDTDSYCGIESVWNHLNYWVNMQDSSKGIGNFDYDLSNTQNWEHFLIGEPINWRLQKPKDLEEEEVRDMYDEKHLDMPLSWSMRISIPHDVLKKRFPEGTRTTFYKRTCVEEFAPYVAYDGMEKRITRFDDFQCTKFRVVEEYFNNRRDKLYKSINDVETNLVTDFFADGREDSVIKHVYHKNNDLENAERTIFFNSEARYDALSKIEVEPDKITENYEKRDDRLYYRQVTYTAGPEGSSETTTIQGVRRPILVGIKINDLHVFFCGCPPISEMGEDMIFRPELTYGYQAEIGAKPIRSLTLFLLFEEQLKEEDKVLNSIRDIEIQISEFLLTRAHELAFTKLDISLFNKEQNLDFRSGMLEKEQQQRVCKEKEVEEETDYLAPYLARSGNPNHLTYQQALDAKKSCYDDFKQLLVDRANNIQRTFEKTSDLLREKKNYYTANHDTLTPEEEALYFEEVNDLILYLKTLEIRLQRHKDLSPLRFDALNEYMNSHPMLAVLRRDLK
ncbi:unnamed protein product [Phaedon cochleariae]|uniref:Dynein regulatory complex subunit 7 n=1 Tax=Phaedon cochleariae TaxID=80249 RepID=A0A9N9SII9_PHACE|nr:unnamed protein product [Phaedon cochleariae]